MTEQEEEVQLPEREVPFAYGPEGDRKVRNMWVRMPTPEQILVWQRTVSRLSEAPIDAKWSGSEVMGALERVRKITDSMLVNRADVDWLDDQFLDKTVGFRDLAPYVTEVTLAFKDAAEEAAPNREARRAIKKTTAKKAARKATSR